MSVFFYPFFPYKYKTIILPWTAKDGLKKTVFWYILCSGQLNENQIKLYQLAPGSLESDVNAHHFFLILVVIERRDYPRSCC